MFDAKHTSSWHQVLVSPRLTLELQGKTWLCGLCAARPAPHIVKHARATQTSTHRARKAHTLTELGKKTQKSANIDTTHKGKNNTTDGVAPPVVRGANVGALLYAFLAL